MAVEDSTTKRCYKCGETKPKTEFHKLSASRDGLQYRCKCCARSMSHKWRIENLESARAKGAAWRTANPEKAKAAIAAWNAANPDNRRAINAAWVAANQEKRRATAVSYYLANKEKIDAYRAAWYAENKDKKRIQLQNYRAKQRENGGKLSKGLAERLYKLQKGKCACCGLSLGDDYHLDHIMPISRGGSNTDDNIQLLRAECNKQKSAKHPVDFMQQRGFLL